MFHLEHLNLVVHDIDSSVKFYQAAFPHWVIRGGGKGSWYGKARNWVHLGDDYQYLTLNDDADSPVRDIKGHQAGVAHFAFVVDDIDGVTQRLTQAGFTISNDGANETYKRNIYFTDPDGIEVEFVQYLTDIPAQRNQYQ